MNLKPAALIPKLFTQRQIRKQINFHLCENKVSKSVALYKFK